MSFEVQHASTNYLQRRGRVPSEEHPTDPVMTHYAQQLRLALQKVNGNEIDQLDRRYIEFIKSERPEEFSGPEVAEVPLQPLRILDDSAEEAA